VPKGFVRERSEYTVDPSGLRLKYRVEDRQVYRMPPAPAFKAEGEYTEQFKKWGGMRYGTVRVKLFGDPATDRIGLIDTCVKVAATKLRISGAVQEQGGARRSLIMEGTITNGMYENWVECRLTAMMQPMKAANPKGRVQGIAGLNFGPAMAVTPGSEPPEGPQQMAYADRGRSWVTAPAGPGVAPGDAMPLLQACRYYDPSLRNSPINKKTGQMTFGGPEVGTAGTTLEG
jgi:hypothetical protein